VIHGEQYKLGEGAQLEVVRSSEMLEVT